MNDSQRADRGDYSAVSVSPSESEYHDIAWERNAHLVHMIPDEPQISGIIPVQMPVRRIRSWIERCYEPKIHEDSHQEHATVNTDTFDVTIAVVRCSGPASGLGHYESSLLFLYHLPLVFCEDIGPVMICGGGTYGKPRKFARLENLDSHVAEV